MKGEKARKPASGALSKPAEETNLKKRKQAPPKDDKGKKRQTKKERDAKKDPNKPKRPPSAFFVFLEEFRKQFKADHPNNKSVSAVGKAGGDKWKSLSEADKAPYVAKAAKRKVDYEKSMQSYNSKQSKAVEKEDSKSEVEEAEESEEVEEEDEDEDD